MSNCIIIRETCKRDRTKSGRWSRKTYDHKRSVWSEEQFKKGTDAGWKAFFGAREQRAYTCLGYVPCRWTYEDPTGTGYVDTYSVVHFDNLGYREKFALSNAADIDFTEDGGYELAEVHYRNEDGESRSITLNITNRGIAA